MIDKIAQINKTRYRRLDIARLCITDTADPSIGADLRLIYGRIFEFKAGAERVCDSRKAQILSVLIAEQINLKQINFKVSHRHPHIRIL